MRHVHTVRLTAPQDSLIQRGSILLEDALHVASMPEPEGERVLIVRSLNVGAIRSHQSSASLALTVQQRLSEMSANAVYAIDPAAERASAVYFRNDAEPYWVLATRLAKGLPATEWFWQLVIPHWKPNPPKIEGLRQLVYQVGQTHAGVSATATFVQHLIEQKAIAPLLIALSWQDGDRLLQLAGLSRPTSATILPKASSDFFLDPIHSLLLHQAVLNWGNDDPRAIWLAAIILIHNNPARLVDSRLADRVVSLLQKIRQAQSSELGDRSIQQQNSDQKISRPDSNLDPNQFTETTSKIASEITSQEKSETTINPVEPVTFFSPTSTQDSTSTSSNRADNSTHSTPQNIPVLSPSDPSNPSPTWANAPQLTPYAGLIFLIPLLDRLQIATFLENHPESIELDLPRQILRTMSDRLQIPPTDPTQSLIPTRKALRRNPQSLIPNPQIRLWITNLRRWSRRNIPMGLYTLICRPGRILISKTHIDVFFHHEQADIRLRRVGLDLNPGWVPWWGQVISFHYIQGE